MWVDVIVREKTFEVFFFLRGVVVNLELVLLEFLYLRDVPEVLLWDLRNAVRIRK